MRDEFSADVKDILARRAGIRCSNPDCRRPSSGPRDAPDKAVNIGVAAHITAATPGGPRYDESLSSEGRKAIENGIWLCQNCAKLIDNDAERFTTNILRRWKSLAEEAARLNVETAAYTTSLPWDLELDRAVYKKLQESLPWNGSVLFLRQHDFGGSFSWDKLDDLDTFCAECLNPHFEFIDTELERIRKDLLEKIQQFTDILSHNTWPHETYAINTSRVSSVPAEWRRTDRERYTQVTEQLNTLSFQIGECYDLIVKLGRRRFGVEGT
jgi:hypothetical protein